jgi:hypothetical protein
MPSENRIEIKQDKQLKIKATPAKQAQRWLMYGQVAGLLNASISKL